MHDPVGGGSDQQQQPGVAGADPKVFVATTLAALVLAGSAYIWKSGSIPMLGSRQRHAARHAIDDDKTGIAGSTDTANSPPRRNTPRKATLDPGASRAAGSAGGEAEHRRRGSQAKSDRELADSTDGDHDAAGSFGQRQQEAGASATGSSLGRTSRPKERRKRGKDPTKELFKSGKLNKAINATVGKPKADASSGANTQRQPSPSRSPSRVSSESQGHSSTPRPQRRSSRSPTRNLSSSSPPVSDDATISQFNPTSNPPARDSSRSRSRLRQAEPSSSQLERSPSHSALDSLASSIANLDAASTTSSASSSMATASSSGTHSTAPSSLTSPTRETTRLNDSDGTPKAEVPKPDGAALTQGTGRPSGADRDPWDWDGAGELNSPHSGPASGSTKPPRIQPKATNAGGTNSSSEVLSGNAPLAYASVVSASGKASTPSSSRGGKTANLEESSSQPFIRRYLDEDDDRLDDAEPEEFSFPSLNNPDSSSASPFSTGESSAASSVSRPQSRASTSSASSKGKPKQARPVSGLAPLSTRSGPISSPSGSGPGHRRAPTPKDGRPGTPSSASIHPPPSPSSSSFHTPGFVNSGPTVAVSAQTQLASLRGALEAARLREEKSKQELEKVSRETDVLRWENAAWRRRESEMQSQMQQMAHQMQAYAVYVASMNHHAAQASQGQASNPLAAPLPVPASQSSAEGHPPSDSANSGEQATEKGDDAGSATESSGPNNQLHDSNSGIAVTSSVPGDLAPPSKPDEEIAPDAPSDATGETPKDKDTADGFVSPASPPQPLPPNGIQPLNTLPYAPQPIHSPLASAFPIAPMGVPYPPRPLSSFLHHHPGSPNPQSPVGGQFPFQFPYMPHMTQHQPGAHSPQAPAMHHHHPPFPVMPLQMNGHPVMQPMQSPVHPGMMMMHSPYTRHSPSASLAGGSSPFSPNMGLGGSAAATNPHASSSSSSSSPLWMNGNTASQLGGRSMSPSDLAGVSAPSSPLPAFYQPERGRLSRAGMRRPGSNLALRSPGTDATTSPNGLNEDGESGRVRDGSGDEVAVDDEEDDGEFNVLLADAILKRPSSIRMGSKRSSGQLKDKLGPVGLAGSVSVDGLWSGVGSSGSLINGYGSGDESRHVDDDGQDTNVQQRRRKDQEEDQEEIEFTFPSLSELGNVAREKRVGTPALTDVASSSLPNGASGLNTLNDLGLKTEGDGSKSNQ